MHKTKRQAKDKAYRKAFYRIEIQRLTLKAILSNEFLPKNIREEAQNKLALLARARTFRIKNRCIDSDRSRAVYRAFKLSRSKVNLFAHNGLLPGVRRSSW